MLVDSKERSTSETCSVVPSREVLICSNHLCYLRCLGPILWHQAEGIPEPSVKSLPFFTVLSITEAMTFGLGVSFLAFESSVVCKIADGLRLLTWAAHLSMGWLSVSWWPHDNLHQPLRMYNKKGLLYIEDGFPTCP